MVYEGRFREPHQSDRWLTHQRGKIMRALAEFEPAPPDPNKVDIVGIGLACALSYLDWRKPVDWRSNSATSGLARGFCRNEPAFRDDRRPRREIIMPQTADTPADPPYWIASPSKPKLKLPPGASDAHVHVFGPREKFPFADGRNYTPSDATKEMLFALHARLGIEHCVIVQPNCHGYDNRSPRTRSPRPATYRGVALVHTDVSDAELKRLDAAGLSGARFHYMEHLRRAPRSRR